MDKTKYIEANTSPKTKFAIVCGTISAIIMPTANKNPLPSIKYIKQKSFISHGCGLNSDWRNFS